MVLSAWLFGAPTTAWAENGPHVDLTYEVDPTLEGCLDAAGFRAVVVQRLGYDPQRVGVSPGVEVRVRSSDAGIEGTIEWISTAATPLGERRFASASRDCHDMTTTMAFVVAVQIQLMATEQSEELVEPANTGPPPHRASEPRLAPPRAAALPDTQRPAAAARAAVAQPPAWRVIAGAGPSAGFGLSPNPVGQGRLFLAGHARHGWLELGGEATFPTTAHLGDRRSFQHDLVLGTAAACFVQAGFQAGAVTKLGRVRVRGRDVDRPASAQGFVAQVGPRLAYSLRLNDRLLLLGHVEGLFLLTPWTVELNQTPVWTMPRLSVSAGIALGYRFP